MAYSHSHGGHRNRMRKKFIEKGIDAFNDHEALELLLYYAVPQKDTNELAHRLINHFGSISSLFDSTPSALRDFGLTEHQLTLIKLIPELARLYLTDRSKDRPIDSNNLCAYFADKFIGRTEEVMYLLLLDSKDKELFSGVISEGSINSTDVPIRKIVELALSRNASGVAIAHNHLSGVALPSRRDMTTTVSIIKALRSVNVNFIDHVIVAEDDSISLMQSIYGRNLIVSEDE